MMRDVRRALLPLVVVGSVLTFGSDASAGEPTTTEAREEEHAPPIPIMPLPGTLGYGRCAGCVHSDVFVLGMTLVVLHFEHVFFDIGEMRLGFDRGGGPITLGGRAGYPLYLDDRRVHSIDFGLGASWASLSEGPYDNPTLAISPSIRYSAFAAIGVEAQAFFPVETNLLGRYPPMFTVGAYVPLGLLFAWALGGTRM